MAIEENVESPIPVGRSCGSTVMYYRQLEVNPEFQQKQMELEAYTADAQKLGGAAAKLSVIVIPVAVHIVFNTPKQNISDSQVKSQIAVLNRDFRMKNTDLPKVPAVWKGLAADARIEFALLKDESKAITRTQTNKVSFGTNESVKFTALGGHDVFDPENVLNLWVCNLTPPLLGYAQFPGGDPKTDGVVITYHAFGKNGSARAPFNLGRTATHEIGHYLNLRHIWGDTQDCSGTDFVDDTPNAQLPNNGSPIFPHISCSNGPDGDMFMNYMDYVDDNAMFMFTRGQVERMSATLLGARNGLVS